MKAKFLILLLFIRFQSAAQSIYDTLTTKEKIEIISLFWKEASYNFVFFDKARINWDSAYYEYLPRALQAKNVYQYHSIVSEFARLLKDGHTGFWNMDYFWKDLGSVPLSSTRINNRFFVTRLDERLKDEIPLGTEIVAVNNQPVDSFYRHGGSFFGIKGEALSFTFKTRGGKIFSKTITKVAGKDRSVRYYPAAAPWVLFDSRWLDKDIYYVKINSFADSTVASRFQAVLPAVRKAKYLILDIRENGGGNSDYARKIAEYLVDKNYTVGSAWKSRINRSANKAWGSMVLNGQTGEDISTNKDYFENNVWESHPGDTLYRQDSIQSIHIPVAVLTGPGTFSAAEDFLIFLDGSPGVTLIGRPTAGSSGQPITIRFSNGMSARICAKRDSYPDGMEFVGIGIKPAIVVERTLDDFLNNKDKDLETAMRYLEGRSN